MASIVDKKIMTTFENAAEFVRQVAGQLTPENLLFLYARFKQAREGKCNVPKPYFFNFEGKQKWEAWTSLGNMTKEDAMNDYVDYLSELFPNWEEELDDNNEVKDGNAGLGISVSRMVSEDDVIPDCDKTVFDWCKEGNVKNVERCLTEKKNYDINKLDEEGMTLLHWASDRGLADMVSLLLSHKADQNKKDSDGQTPLHFAVECQHFNVVKVLLDNQANPMIKDSDGISPLDIDTTSSIKKLLDTYSITIYKDIFL
ncbi:acyl-CoA-binding domain-containing protein 6 [Patella vulgata]|uniref:acyl-CoA-binding domain-containing protein 6 n=1 Tax=Patella vulgata TaxID=6465 RepID=UPI00217F404D|nr:acyl-CoA-binding domain-containing protein 6 [Patella vulgata]